MMLTCRLIVIIGNVILGLAWPAGYLLGLIASRSSDPAGKGYAVLTVWAVTVILTYLAISAVFVVTGHIYWTRMSTWLKVFILSPAWITAAAISIGIIAGVGIALDWWCFSQRCKNDMEIGNLHKSVCRTITYVSWNIIMNAEIIE